MAESAEITKIDEKVIVTTSPIQILAPSLSRALVKAEPAAKKPPPIEFDEAETVTDGEKYIAKFRCEHSSLCLSGR